MAYAAYIVDALDELAARAVVPLVSKSANFVALRGSAERRCPPRSERAQIDAS
jgi:hypothetical protein